MKKLTHNEFVEKLSNVNMYFVKNEIFLLSNYINNRVKIKVKTKYGICSIIPNGLLNNKIPCISCAIDKTKYFISLAKEKYGNKYDYSLVKYVNSHQYVDIVCLRHGKFKQKPYLHLLGRGCMKCHIETTIGWDWKTWRNKGIKSKNFDSFKVYIIKCWNDNEEFYKIGRTYTHLNKRFRDDDRLPYKYEIVKIFEGEAKEMFDLENKLKTENKEFKYNPNIKFKGYTECYKKIQI
jgi:hypothetical protein